MLRSSSSPPPQASPLIVAIEQKSPMHVLQWLVKQDGGALDDRYKFQKTCLHTAASHKASPEVLRYILDLRPNATRAKDSWGRTPLWRAAADPGISSDCLSMLLNPVDTLIADRSGQLPLHAAAGNGVGVSMLAAILGANPDTIRSPDNNGRLPLHAACSGGHAEVERLQFLLDAYPEAVRMVDKQGSLPFHLVCKRKASPDVLAFLMEEYPEAVRTPEMISGAHPFQLAAAAGVPIEVLEVFLQACPEAAESRDKTGNTTLHMVCQRRPPIELIQFLLSKHPEAPSLCNDNQSLPLHLAVENRSGWPILNLLIQEYSPAVRMINNKGRVPLHEAFRTKAPTPTLVRLAQLFPPGVHHEDVYGKIPEDYTTDLKAEKFHKARRNYNCCHAFCPCFLRDPKK
jgi:ankyrin repeat protein